MSDLKPMFSGPLAFEPTMIDTPVSFTKIDSVPFEEECGVVVHPLSSQPDKIAISLFDDLEATSVCLNLEQIQDLINSLKLASLSLVIANEKVAA